MRRWWPTSALLRAVSVAAIGLTIAVVTGSPVAAVLAAPFALVAAPALRHRPRSDPEVRSRLEHTSLREGQGTRSLLDVRSTERVEHVTRVAVPTAYVAQHPVGGRVGALVGAELAVELSPRRWGRRRLGHERVWVASAWSGYRFGPVEVLGEEVSVLPQGATYDSRAEAPQPRGLVGAHRSARESSGTEFAGIRAFQPGDRLRRINWRVSSRSQQLHVTSSRAEDDAGVLLVVDALVDLGRPGGIEAASSSLDLAVRGAAALAEHYLLRGDRVGVRVIGLEGVGVGFGSGRPHLRRLLGTLAAIRAGAPHDGELDQLRLRAGAGTTVVVLSPMLSEAVAAATADLVRRGLPTLVVDTLPPTLTGADVNPVDPSIRVVEQDVAHRAAVRQAWRMRVLEREQILASLSAVGCPVVPWRGPGTLDAVLLRLARRASLPRAR